MSLVIEKNEKSVITAKLDISKELFQKGIEVAYNKNKGQFRIDGFRQGKAPRGVIERKYGKSVFYEEALEESFSDAYVDAVTEAQIYTVAGPKLISVDEIGEDGAKITIEIPVRPEFELPEYKGIKVGSLEYILIPEDLEAELKELQEKNSRLLTITEGETMDKDELKIDFDGYVDGVAFDGGKATDYPIAIGSNTFIPGFEDQLIGKKLEEEFDVVVTFPEEYHAPNLSGKESVFKVTIHEIQRREYPVIDDEFALDLGFDDLDALKKDVSDKLIAKNTEEIRKEAEQKIIDNMIERTEMDIAPAHLEERTEELKETYEERLRSNGMDPKMYYEYVLSMSEDNDPMQFIKKFQEQADRAIRSELIFTKIVEELNFEISEEEFEAETIKVAELYKQDLETFKTTIGEQTKAFIESAAKQTKMFKYLLENADTTLA